MVKLSYTILYVQDVVKSINFYEQAFDLKRKFISPDNDYGELITGETTLSFASVALAESNLSKGFIPSNTKDKPFGVELGFTTGNVEETVQQALKAGAVEVEKAKQKPWGQIVAYLRDPDGFLLEICTAMP